MDHADQNQKKDVMFYGRRHGRRLRPRQQDYLEQGMAQFGMDASLQDGAPATLDPQSLFSHNPQDTYLEIGFGGGEHLAARARTAPECGFVGAEPFMNGVASLCRHLIEDKSANTRIWPEDIRLLLPVFKPQSFAGVFILFPDPWPKSRHQSRRIIQHSMLDELHRLIRPEGRLLLASDDPVAKTWMLSLMMRRGDFEWQVQSKQDWQTPPEDWPGDEFTTRYMAKANSAGRASSWFVFTRKTSA